MSPDRCAGFIICLDDSIARMLGFGSKATLAALVHKHLQFGVEFMLVDACIFTTISGFTRLCHLAGTVEASVVLQHMCALDC